MPSILTKLLMPEWSFTYNCYEVGHTWTPFCSEAALDAAISVFRQSIKLYTPLYLLQHIFTKRKLSVNAFNHTLVSILRSSTFLSFTIFSLLLLFCGVRRITGRFYWTLIAWIPSFVSSYLSIYIERPSRRGTLAIYCANIASETLYRNLVSNNYIKPIPNGQTVLFTISISILLYIIRKNGYSNDPISIALKVILGTDEAKLKTTVPNVSELDYSKTNKNNNSIKSLNNYNKSGLKSKFLFINKLQEFLNTNPTKHESCPHRNSCLCYTVSAFGKAFTLGWLTHIGLQVSQRPHRLLSSDLRPNYLAIKSIIRSMSALKFGLFIGGFSSLFKTTNCLLRWSCGASHDWHVLASGIISGPMMLLSPNHTIAIYLLWKCIESMYCMANKTGHIKHSDKIIILVYSLSVSQLFYATILNPKTLRKSYIRFIDKVTENRLQTLNRLVLDVFGTDASQGYENYFPDLDLRFVSRKFQETILNWLI